MQGGRLAPTRLALVGLLAASGCGELEGDPYVEAAQALITHQIDAVVNDDARCEELRQDFANCIGVEQLPIACESLGPSDVDNFEQALDAFGCEGIAQLAPLDGDALALSCVLFGEGCVDATNPAPSGPAAQFPIVLVNGIDVSPLFSWSERIVAVMQEAGHDVHLAVLPPYEAPRRRAPVLWNRIQEIREETGAARVNLLCHSLGGLDCRYLASPAGLHWDLDGEDGRPDVRFDDIVGAVASVTTVGTAHRGTPVADQALGLVPGADAGEALDALASVLGSWLTEDALTQNVHLRDALAALSMTQATAFNAQIVDAEEIYYQSWAGVSHPDGEPSEALGEVLGAQCAPSDEARDGDGLRYFGVKHDYLALPLRDGFGTVSEGPDGGAQVSDGLCPAPSARWANFRGCLPADHMEQLGRRNLPDANVRTRLDIAWFYAGVAAELAELGF